MTRSASVVCAVVAVGGAMCVARAGDFADQVMEYRPAPGQFVNNPTFNNPAKALGAPVGGGTVAADNTKLVTLGGFGGSITLRFIPPVVDDPRNPLGLDAIVFGNAVWVGGDPQSRFGEAGVIEISCDDNGNGLADDAWFVIPGSHLPRAPGGSPSSVYRSQQWDANAGTPTPPANVAWYPSQVAFPGWPSSYATAAFELPSSFAASPLLNGGGTTESRWGYADFSPTLRLGDLSGASGGPGENSLSDPEDRPTIDPGAFYTTPDDLFTVGVSRGSGGGDAFDIAWAVDPATGAPPHLDRFDFIRISTAVDAVLGPGGSLGEISTEISGVARVRPVMTSPDVNGDGVVNSADLGLLLGAWGACPQPGACPADLTGDSVVNSADLAALLGAWGPAP